MGEERGGLQYAIVVEDVFSKATEAFQTEIAKCEAGWRSFSRAGAAESEQTTRLADALGSIEKVLKSLNAERETAVRASKAQTEATSDLSKGERKLLEIMERRETLEEAHTLATQRDIDITRKITQERFVEAAAIEKVNAAKHKALVDARAAEIAKEQGIRLGREETKVLTTSEEAQRRLNKMKDEAKVKAELLRIATEQGIKVTREEVRALTAVEEAARRAAAAKREAEVGSILLSQGLDARGNSIGQIGPPTPASGLGSGPAIDPRISERSMAALRGVGAELDAVDSAANRVAFTFRRLVGIFAAFQAVRFVFAEIKQAIGDSVAFNAQVETSNLGIAALLVTSGDVRTAMGDAVAPTRQFALAQAEARRQMELLRMEGRATAATVQQLVETYQTALAPGLRAGLNPDQIRKFTIQVSQAASALGLAQSQLPEEIRSTLSGTGQARTTRLLNIVSNEDIRRAREAGTLSELLTERFGALALAGEKAQATFDLLFANVKKDIQEILGTGGKDFFDALKALGGDAQSGLRNAGGELNPVAVQSVKALAEGLKTAAEEGRRLMDAIGGESLLQMATAAGDVVAGIAVTAGRLAEGFLRAGAALAPIVRSVGAIFSFLDRITGGVIGPLVTYVAQFATIAGAIKITLAAWAALLSFAAKQAGVMLAEVTATQLALSVLGKLTSSLLSPIGLIVGGITLLGFLFDDAATGAGAMADAVGGAGTNALSLSEILKSMPLAMQATNKELEENAKLMEQLRKDSEKAGEALAVALASVGIRGAVAKQVKDAIEGEQKAREAARTFATQEQTAAGNLLGIRDRIAKAQERYNARSEFAKGLIDREVASLGEQIRLQEAIAQASEKIAGLKGSEQIEQAALVERMKEQLAVAERSAYLGASKQVYDAETTGLIRDRVVLVTEEKLGVEAVAHAARERAAAENAARDSANLRIRAIAEEEAFDAEQKRRLAAASLATEFSRIDVLREQAAVGAKLGDVAQRIADAQGGAAEAAVKLAVERDAVALEERALETEIADAISKKQGLQTQLDAEKVEQRRTTLTKQIRTAEEAIAALLRQQERSRERNRTLLDLEKVKLDGIVEAVLLRARIESALSTRGTDQKTRVAAEDLDAERARLSIRAQNESLGFTMLATTKKILEAEADIGPARARLAIYREQTAEKTRQLRGDIEAAARSGDTTTSAALAEELRSFTEGALVETTAREAKIRDIAETQLSAAREQAVVDVRARQDRLALDRASLTVEKAKAVVLREEEAIGFRMTSAERAMLSIEENLGPARAKVDVMLDQASLAERAQEGLVAAAKTDRDRVAFAEQLRAMRANHLLSLDIELTKMRAISETAEAQIRRDSAGTTRGINESALPGARADVDAQRLRNQAALTRGMRAQRLEAQAELRVAQTKLSVDRATARVQEQDLVRTIAGLRRVGASDATIEAKEDELLAVRKLNTAELEKQARVIEGISDKLNEQTQASMALLDEAVQTLEDVILGLADTLGSAMADALDPTKDVDMKERFRTFFLGIFQQVATFLLEVALLVIALNAIPGFAAVMAMMGGLGNAGKVASGLSGIQAAPGKAEGGRIEGGSRAAPAHIFARGFADGGRPTGLDPTDTVPIWAAPGEWMMRTAAVSTYGEDVMAAINEGLVDPASLRGLAGGYRAATGGSRAKIGFATGGPVSGRGGRGGGGTTVLPVFPVTEADMEVMLRAGDGAIDRMIRRKGSLIRGIVGAQGQSRG